MDYYFFFKHILEKYQFRKRQKHSSRNIFSSPQNNRTWPDLLTVENYTKLKDMLITLKRIGKILFVSVLRTFQICKFLNFTTVFTKKTKNFQGLHINLRVRKLISV